MRLVVCDDHRLLLEALSLALGESGQEVLAMAVNTTDAVAAVREHQPDAVLLDLNFPDGTALGSISDLRQACPTAKIVILSASADHSVVAEAIAQGAHGFIGKDRPVADIVGALEQAQWLAEMVDEVLVGAKADGAEYVDAGELAQGCAHRARPTAACEVRCESTGTLIVLAQPVALSRAVGCLIDNAVRAAGDGGHVDVLVSRSGGCVEVVVVDDGPGLGHVAARTSLGLTITRALVASCGGRFELSPGETGGAVARISLPAAAPEAAAS